MIIDVMDYTEKQNLCRVYILFIDFENAFDSLNWSFMLRCLNVLGYGSSLMQ